MAKSFYKRAIDFIESGADDSAGTSSGSSSTSSGELSAAGRNVLSYDSSKKQTDPLASGLTDYYMKNLQSGGINDATRAKWAEMDNATATAGAQTKMDAVSPGMFGQGAATRSGQLANNSVMQQVAANKLKQAQMAGDASQQAAVGAQSWQSQQNTQSDADRQFAYTAARDIGDTVTQAGMGKESLGQQGYDYTDYGQKALTDQATQQAEDAKWYRDAQREQWQIQKDQNALAMKQAKESYDNDPMTIGKRWISKGASALTSIFD